SSAVPGCAGVPPRGYSGAGRGGAAAAEFRGEGSHGFDAAVAQGGDQGGADNDAVGVLADLADVLGLRDAQADAGPGRPGRVGGFDDGPGRGGDRGAGPGDAHDGHAVHEAAAGLDGGVHALGGGTGGDEEDAFQAVLVGGGDPFGR